MFSHTWIFNGTFPWRFYFEKLNWNFSFRCFSICLFWSYTWSEYYLAFLFKTNNQINLKHVIELGDIFLNQVETRFLYLSKVFCTIQKTQNASVWMHPESDDKQKIDLIKTEMNTLSMIRKKWHCHPWYSRSLMIIMPTYSGTKTNPNDQGVWTRGMGFRDRHRSPCFRESRSKNFQGWQNPCMNSCIRACVKFVPLRF